MTWHQQARRGAVLAAFVATSVLALGGSAHAAEDPPGARDIRVFACPTDEVPPDGFTDTSGNTFEYDIRCLSWYGITSGGPGNLPSTQYGPSQAVHRDQMATFVARFIDYIDDTLLDDYDGTNQFTDVPQSNVHIANINRLADAGIVQGGVGGRPTSEYSPGLDVRRDQMASFIAGAMEFIFDSTVCANVANYFDDDDGFIHEPCINALADLGVVEGRAPGVYAPSAPVTRAQMSAYLMRSMDIFVEQQLAETPAS